jgi:hypothetical protein
MKKKSIKKDGSVGLENQHDHTIYKDKKIYGQTHSIYLKKSCVRIYGNFETNS